MTNGRQLYRKYAKSKGNEAVSFVEIEQEGYGYPDTLITKDSNGKLERTSLDYHDFTNWIINKCNVEVKQ